MLRTIILKNGQQLKRCCIEEYWRNSTHQYGASNKILRGQSFAKGYFTGNSDFLKTQLAFHKEAPT
jgi:hypothetical protein